MGLLDTPVNADLRSPQLAARTLRAIDLSRIAGSSGTAPRLHDDSDQVTLSVDDEEALDHQWLSFTTTSKPDKAAIKEALKAGHLIPGAQLISRRSWRIH
jgi:hypothetical protein